MFGVLRSVELDYCNGVDFCYCLAERISDVFSAAHKRIRLPGDSSNIIMLINSGELPDSGSN